MTTNRQKHSLHRKRIQESAGTRIGLVLALVAVLAAVALVMLFVADVAGSPWGSS